MKRENKYRQPSIERWIGNQPDGVLHATTPGTPVEGPKRGTRPYQNMDEIRLCLNCKKAECELDHHKRCRKLLKLWREQRERKGEENERRESDEGG
jgi:hypothetical protein